MRGRLGAGMNESATPASPPPTPVWVKALGIAVLLAILGFVVFHFTGSATPGH